MTEVSRIETPISRAELERRWAAVRKEMADRGIDALIVQSTNDWLGGYVKWFTDVPANYNYPRTILFMLDDLMTVIEMGDRGRRDVLDGSDPFQPGVGLRISSPSFTSAHYTHRDDADLLADELSRRAFRTVGWIARGNLPFDLVATAEQRNPATSFVDATELVDAIKAVKSAEEMTLIRRAAAMQDAQWAKLMQAVRPGMRESEIAALAQYEGEKLGSEQGLFRGSSAPLGEPAILRGRHFQGRVMGAGEYMTLLIENSGPGGHYAELARSFVFGKATQEQVDALALVKEAQQHTVALLRPGQSCAEIFRRHNDFMNAHGAPPERRLYAHSQGYDLVERPLIRDDETASIAASMNIAVHPYFPSRSNFGFLCDNFLVNADGVAERLHATEQKIWEL